MAPRRPCSTATCSAFGAAAAAARILELDGLATAQTLGLAGATAAGLRQHQSDGGLFDTAFHGARAAQSGVMVAQLRAAGIGGPPGILDGPMGFCAVLAPERDLSDYPPGRLTPIPRSMIDEKFLANAMPHLGEQGSARALAAIRSLPACGDIGTFMEALRPAKTQPR